MSFLDDLNAFNALVQRRRQFVARECVRLAFESIVEGSSITGAPGQPVGETGETRDSWRELQESPTSTLIVSDHPNAQIVEDNVGGVVYVNHGPHSVKLTIAGWQRIVDEATKRAHQQVR